MTAPTHSNPEIRGKRNRRAAPPGPSRSLDDMDLRFSFSLPGGGWWRRVRRRVRFTMGADISDPPPLEVRIKPASHFSDFLAAEYQKLPTWVLSSVIHRYPALSTDISNSDPRL